MKIVSGLFFFKGSYLCLLAGSICYYAAFVLDCVDGPVARLTDRVTTFGRYFDHISDLIGGILLLGCLASGQNLLFSNMLLSMFLFHIAECYISFLTGLIIERRTDSVKIKDHPWLDVVIRYRNFFFNRNLKSFLSLPDYEAVVFILFPVLGLPATGIRVGYYLLIVIVLYTIFSSFVTIMTGGDKFP